MLSIASLRLEGRRGRAGPSRKLLDLRIELFSTARMNVYKSISSICELADQKN
jgi:hypothetical protein